MTVMSLQHIHIMRQGSKALHSWLRGIYPGLYCSLQSVELAAPHRDLRAALRGASWSQMLWGKLQTVGECVASAIGKQSHALVNS